MFITTTHTLARKIDAYYKTCNLSRCGTNRQTRYTEQEQGTDTGTDTA